MKISINAAFFLVLGLALTASAVEHEEEEKGNPEFLVDAPNMTIEEIFNDELTKSNYRGPRGVIHPECGYCGYSLWRRVCGCACKNGPQVGPNVRLCNEP